jgi:hypothetical protein
MWFICVTPASSEESPESFIMREVGVYHYKSYEIALKSFTIML